MNSTPIVLRVVAGVTLALGLTVLVSCKPGDGTTQAGGGGQPADPPDPAPASDGGSEVIATPIAESFDNLPALDTVLDDAFATMGGRDAFEVIDSFRVKGRVFTILGDGEIEVHYANPGRIFLRNTYPGGSFVSFGSDGETHWTINPLKGKFTLVNRETMMEAVRNFTYWWDFATLERQASKMSVASRTEFEGDGAYKVHVVRNGRDEYWYFATDGGQPLGLQYTHFRYQDPTVVTISFSNWTEVGGVKVFTRTFLEQLEQGTDINIDEFSFNDVDQSVFVLPDDVQKLVAEGAVPPPAGN